MNLEYHILSVVIERYFLDHKTRLVVLRHQFYNDSRSAKTKRDYLMGMFNELQPITLQSYIDKLAEPTVIASPLSLSAPCKILSDDRAHEIFDSGGWNEFHGQYPESHGIIQISRVGLNSEQTQALACVGITRGCRNGYGSYFLLELDKGAWVIRRSVGAWRS